MAEIFNCKQTYCLISIYFFFFLCGIKQDQKYWPLMPPLPSYGKGREHPGPRYGSLIHGQNLKDVVITGRVLVLSSPVEILSVSVDIYKLECLQTLHFLTEVECKFSLPTQIHAS